MHRSRKFILLFTPSNVSVVCGVVLSVTVILGAWILFASRSGRLDAFLYGPNVPDISIAEFQATLSGLVHTIFDSTLLNKVLFIMFWGLIGFIVYNILYIFKGSVDDSVSFWHEMHYVHAEPGEMRKRLVLRIILLSIALILWLFYGILFATYALPAALSKVSMVASDHRSPLYLLVSLVILFVCTQVAAILLRFTLLKPRLFTGVAEE